MPNRISITFLGTSSGSGPTLSRHCSSLALNLDGEIWLVDCAEGTQLRLVQADISPARVTKIFITHLHVDHVMGLVPLLTTIMFGLEPSNSKSGQRSIDLYGPVGLRQLVRITLQLTGATLAGTFSVHEFLAVQTPVASCPAPISDTRPNEGHGRDIQCDSDGKWKNFQEASGITISAAPLEHRGNSLCWVSISAPGRKLVILGDTSDASSFIGLADDASLLVHEATNAYISPRKLKSSQWDENEKEKLRAKAISRGHSTAEMAGEFAKQIRARRLYLNHFSSMYPDPAWNTDSGLRRKSKKHRERYPDDPKGSENQIMMHAIQDQATEGWSQEGSRAIAATDFMCVEIRGHEVS
ncbi:beta-lactamase-like protein [Cantharellus anzutake]|uniref:beta-lactamase-like protein n=1 Tax=Cantharellus anzutake TaxID=1750568 RepID=UPI001905C834|nr:beta-lactamase-like protein [Cantharellus anzutake]KAF8343183.1 beta-lactamase-like protein [Cantharellus anzutake]